MLSTSNGRTSILLIALHHVNIVGYAQNGLRIGSSGLGTQFFPISGDGIALKDIQFDVDDVYSIAIQTLSPGGTTVDDIYWNDWTEDPDNPGEYLPGFWDDGSGEPTTFKVKPGDGLWIQGSAETDTLQTAGQVGQEDIIVTWDSVGNKLVANSFPVEIPVNDFVFDTTDIYSIAIQTLSAGGTTVDDIYWNDWTEDPENPGEFLPGFWDDGSGEPTTFSVKPGQALWIQAGVGDSVRIPAPEL